MVFLSPFGVESRGFLKQHKLALLIVTILVISLIVILAANLGNGYSAPTTTVDYSNSAPSEEKPGKNYKWRGDSPDPKKLIVPSLGINGYIQKVAVDQNKEVAVPDNIHIAGWFVESVRPGEKGLSIIDGHVDGRTQAGIFIDLDKIKLGSELQIEFGNGTKKIFRVKYIQEIEEDKAASALFSQNPKATNQLNLITCSGDFNKSTKRYEKRFIVSTELVAADTVGVLKHKRL